MLIQQENSLLRFLALGVFTPLMRNHSATGTREQECYQFENIEDFRAVINTRYRLVPYLYSEYMKAALSDDMYFKPLGFVYPDDKRAIRVEDQLMLGNEIMIAPVYEQNAKRPLCLSAGRNEICQVPAGWKHFGRDSRERYPLCRCGIK